MVCQLSGLYNKKTSQKEKLRLPLYFFDGTFQVTMVMASLTAALYTVLYQEEKSARFHYFQDLNSPNEFTSSAAAVQLLHLCRELFQTVSPQSMHNLGVLVEFLGKKWLRLETKQLIKCDCKVTIFSDSTGQILDRFPKKFNENSRQLSLYGSMNNGQIILLGVISNIVEFSHSQFGEFCFYCEKYYSGKGSKHRCKKRRSCFACHRPLLQFNTYTNTNNIVLFCESEMQPIEQKLCSRCNVTLYSPSCQRIHQQKNCRWGWFCLHCKQYTFRSKYLKTVEIIKQTHICFTLFCCFCGERIAKKDKKTHLCPIFKIKPPEAITKLAFLQLNFKGSSRVWCSDCQSTEACSFCKDNYGKEIPNIGVLLLEQQKEIGKFDMYTFTDSDLFNFVRFERNVLHKSYIPENAQEQLCGLPKTILFGNRKTIKVKKTMFEEESTVIGQILNFFIQKKLSNITMLINCSESNEPIFFIAELIQKGLIPKVLKQQGRILMVECQEIGLRILDTQNYFSKSITELAETNTKFVFFPRKWNKNSLYFYLGSIPPWQDFIYFEDTINEISRKKAFVNNFKGLWCLKEELLKNTTQKVFLSAEYFLNFLLHAFEIQNILFRNFELKKKMFLHPVNQPFLTFSAFAYQLFLNLSNADIRMIKGPIEYNSSKGEIEFASFLSYVRKKHLQHTWSPHGQSKEFLPISVPDIYDKEKNTLFFYNGCYIHGHNFNCKFQKGNTHNNALAKQRNKSFFEKVEKLSHHPKVDKIKIMWQCDWTYAKKRNAFVKSFMENIYRNPPTYRLDPYCAGKHKSLIIPSSFSKRNITKIVRGGLTECYVPLWIQSDILQKLYFLDKDGQYAFIAMISNFPIGEYEVSL